MVQRVKIHKNDVFYTCIVDVDANGFELSMAIKNVLDKDANVFQWVMFAAIEFLLESDSLAKVQSHELGLEIGIGMRTKSDVIIEMLPLRFSTQPHDGACLFIGCFPGFVSGFGLSRHLLCTVNDFFSINSDEQILDLGPPRKEIGVIEFGDIVE